MTFVIPLHKDLFAPCAALFVLTSIFNPATSAILKTRWNYVIPSAIFLWYAFSLLYTDDLTNGLNKLETKMALLLLPFGFFMTSISIKENIGSIYRSFVEGVLIAGLISLIHSTLLWFLSGESGHFFYGEFGLFHHTSYSGMYTTSALAIIYYFALKPSKTFHYPPIVNFILILLLSIFTGLLLSRTALFVLFTIHITALSYWMIRHRKIVLGLLSILTISIIFTLFMYSNSNFSERIQSALDVSNEREYSPASKRSALWKINWELAKETPLLGVGDGDADYLQEKAYFENGNKVLKQHFLNAHNQYLQTLVSVGWIGLFTLILPFALIFKNSYRKGIWLPVFLGCIILINFVTEAMLETQSGVVFIAFYLSIFWELTQKTHSFSHNTL
jgi:O-antigen ligase